MGRGNAMTEGIFGHFGWGIDLESDTEKELRLEKEIEDSE